MQPRAETAGDEAGADQQRAGSAGEHQVVRAGVAELEGGADLYGGKDQRADADQERGERRRSRAETARPAQAATARS